MKLLALGDREGGMVLNFDNFTRCLSVAGKKEVQIFVVGSDKPVSVHGEDADIVWNYLLHASREPK